MEDKKKRSPNYTAQEKALLLNILHNFKGIIENKKTDSQTWRDKEFAWAKITKIFNSQCPESHLRSKESLKKYYENIKKSVRKEVAEEKFNQNKTGGGSQDKVSDDGTFDLALGLMNPKTVFGLENPFDGDADIINISIQDDGIQEVEEHIELATDDIVDHPQQPKNEVSLSPMEDWGNMYPKKLKQRSSNKLISPLISSPASRRRPSFQQPSSSKLAEEYSEVARCKLELFKAEKEEMELKRKREEELFILSKKSILLDIEFKQLQLKKIKLENPHVK